MPRIENNEFDPDLPLTGEQIAIALRGFQTFLCDQPGCKCIPVDVVLVDGKRCVECAVCGAVGYVNLTGLEQRCVKQHPELWRGLRGEV